ncbi:mediator-associated protein 2 [Dorcoceras hygrometricum]|uniref:Mediator-associated protein 2 n=1 Tax=Dorcoceras hygrometricum TaxID=472368 RepID=A0A2Z7BKK7_9LAMI|nr:mediator-associated protein 2 [Dorcoceras hygrometricum]
MDVSTENVYQPPNEFAEDKKDPLIDFDITDSTELWLIQWPINQSPDFDGKEFSLKLNGDARIGSFESAAGKSYEVISLKSQGPEPMIFLSSTAEAKIATKISRRVSLIHYPEPGELKKRNNPKSSHSQRSSMATSTLSGRPLATPTRTVNPKNPHIMSGQATSTPSGRTKSTTTQDSAKGNHVVTSTGSMDHSEERKSKKRRKTGS